MGWLEVLQVRVCGCHSWHFPCSHYSVMHVSVTYDYHRSFSAKAAVIFGQHQVVTVWSRVDTELFCSHFAGLRSPVCATCQSSSHTAYWCPNTEFPVPVLFQNWGPHDGTDSDGYTGRQAGSGAPCCEERYLLFPS